MTVKLIMLDEPGNECGRCRTTGMVPYRLSPPECGSLYARARLALCTPCYRAYIAAIWTFLDMDPRQIERVRDGQW